MGTRSQRHLVGGLPAATAGGKPERIRSSASSAVRALKLFSQRHNNARNVIFTQHT